MIQGIIIFNATEFYKYFIENKIAMFLSSIVTCEFCIKQPITDLPLYNFKMLPFNIPDSYNITSVFDDFYNNESNNNRNSVKDDYKITSQSAFNKIDFIITEDKSYFRLLEQLYKSNKIKCKALFLPDGYKKSFNIPATLF